MATILSAINKFPDPLVGLEYLYEVKQKTGNLFACILCDAEFYSHSHTIKHLSSFQHRVAYLKLFYPETMKPALRLLETDEFMTNPSQWMVKRVHFICEEIDKHYPRLNPVASTHEGLMEKRRQPLKGVGTRQFVEDFVRHTFVEADIEHQLEVLGLSSVNFSGNTVDVDQPTKKRKHHNIPQTTRSDLVNNPSASTISEYHKRYSKMFSSVLENQKKYQKDPHSHPQYPAEWDMFWKERSHDFNKAGKDPYDHDFTREWSLYWLERVKQLDIETIDRREKEIRISLHLPEDLEIPSLEDPKDLPPQIHKRAAQFDNQGDAKRSKNTFDPQNDFHRSNTDLRHTLPPQISPYLDCQEDEGFRPEATTSGRNYDDQEPSTSFDYDEDNNDESVTIISVLRLLAAFEDLLGNSLGPKVVDLLSKAVALEKVRSNLSDDLLVSEENNILLDTVKEKMKGMLLTGFVKPPQIPAVRKVIAHINKINKIVEMRVKDKQQRAIADARQNLGFAREKEQKEQEIASIEFRKDVYRQLETSISLQGKLVTHDQLETLTNVYIQKHTANDTPYLFGLQMGSRFPDLPRNDANQVADNLQHHGSNQGFTNMQSAQSSNQAPDSMQFPGNSQQSSQSFENQHNNRRRFGRNNFNQFNQDQFDGGNQNQQWSNSYNNQPNFNNQPDIRDDQQQQQFDNHNQQHQNQFSDEFGQNNHQHSHNSFDNGEFQQQDFNDDGNLFSNNGGNQRYDPFESNQRGQGVNRGQRKRNRRPRRPLKQSK